MKISSTRKQTNLNAMEERGRNKNRKQRIVAFQEKIPQGHPLIRAELVKQSRRAQTGVRWLGFKCRF